jgi:hypothetical protein
MPDAGRVAEVRDDDDRIELGPVDRVVLERLAEGPVLVLDAQDLPPEPEKTRPGGERALFNDREVMLRQSREHRWRASIPWQGGVRE